MCQVRISIRSIGIRFQTPSNPSREIRTEIFRKAVLIRWFFASYLFACQKAYRVRFRINVLIVPVCSLIYKVFLRPGRQVTWYVGVIVGMSGRLSLCVSVSLCMDSFRLWGDIENILCCSSQRFSSKLFVFSQPWLCRNGGKRIRNYFQGDG